MSEKMSEKSFIHETMIAENFPPLGPIKENA